MKYIDKIKELAKQNKKTIILPESNDIRVLKAANIITKENIAEIILIGNKEVITSFANKENINIDDIEIIDQNTYNLTDKIINDFYELRNNKGLTLEEARKIILENNIYFGCMLVKNNLADGLVAGANHYSKDVLKPALQIIKSKDEKSVSSFFIMDTPNKKYGTDGLFIFSDCGLIEEPTSIELADIAYQSSNSFKSLIGEEPITAMLSYSTNGSGSHKNIDKVKEAVEIANQKYPEYLIDGEIQLDAAIDEEIRKIKYPDSKIKGSANVLIFPNLDAGNIGYKLVERFANAASYGPLLQGLNKPINDLSRGCSVDDIIGVVAITALQSDIK